MLEPPARVEAQAVVPREYIFIVDVSGSMHGFPLDITRALMEEIIKGLRPTDFMNVLLFESGNAVLSDSGSLPATDANKEKAISFIKAQPGGGGTEIMPAFKRALALPRTPNTSRIVVVATDGYVRVEPELFDLIRKSLGEANLFPFGIGTSVNRYLIEGMARAGMGEPFVLLNTAEARREAARFKNYISNPVLNHIKVSFSGFGAYEVEPEAVPDLFALRPITVMGKYRGNPGGTIVVTGKTTAGDFRQEVKVADGKAGPDNAGLRLLWAKKRIARLTDQSFLEKGQGPLTKEITGLGLKYSLMTQYTSFVAVDQVKRADGTVVTVKQPLPLPQGVSGRAIGEMDGGFAPGAGKMMAPPLPSHYAGRVSSRKPMGEPTEITTGKKEEKGKPSLRILETAIKGAVDQAAVETALEGALPKLETCLKEAAARGVKLPTEIEVTLTLGPDGRITFQPLLKTPGGDPALGKCLQETLKGVTFPKPAQGQVTVTVKLSVQGG
jgi:Ca-activated chloride channel family protein